MGFVRARNASDSRTTVWTPQNTPVIRLKRFRTGSHYISEQQCSGWQSPQVTRRTKMRHRTTHLNMGLALFLASFANQGLAQIQVAGSGWQAVSTTAPAVAIDNNGTKYIAWNLAGSNQILVATSPANTNTWTLLGSSEGGAGWWAARTGPRGPTPLRRWPLIPNLTKYGWRIRDNPPRQTGSCLPGGLERIGGSRKLWSLLQGTSR